MFRNKAKWLLAISIFPAAVGATSLTGNYFETDEFGTSEGDGKFGISVAIWGNEAIVSTPQPDSASWGSATIYRLDGARWEIETSLTDIQSANDFGAYLGCNPVAIEGDVAVVGEPSANAERGVVSVFRRTSAGWINEVTLQDDAGSSFDSFGCAVAISNGQILVGAPNKNSIGQGYVYSYDGARWKLDDQLIPVGASTRDAVGLSGAVSGNEVVLGAPHAASDRGTAFVFRKSGAKWSQIKALKGSDSSSGDQFGASVAINNGTVVVGAPVHSLGEGAAYVFAGGSLIQQQKLSLSGTSYLGASVAIDGDRMAVARLGSDTVDLFGRFSGTWFKTGIAEGAHLSHFGGSVAVSGPNVLIGAYSESGGRAYMLKDDHIFRDGLQ